MSTLPTKIFWAPAQQKGIGGFAAYLSRRFGKRRSLVCRNELWIERRDFDGLLRLLGIDDDRFARLNIDQLVFDLLIRFQ